MIWSPPRRWSPSRQQFYKQFNKTYLDHITLPLQNKVRRLYFIFCMFYVAARAFRIRTVFLPTKTTTTAIRQLSLLHPFRGPPL